MKQKKNGSNYGQIKNRQSKLQDTKGFLKEFMSILESRFQPYLETFGFHKELKEVQKDFGYIIFRKDNLYIKVMVSISSRNIPYYWNIVLGDGTALFPESDWNAIALWRIRNIHGNQNSGEYVLSNLKNSDIASHIELGKYELDRYGLSFLKGDLKEFYKIRKEVNSNREPYKIYQVNKSGELVQVIDRQSSKLKKKFS